MERTAKKLMVSEGSTPYPVTPLVCSKSCSRIAAILVIHLNSRKIQTT
jgi:hypothetical protein